MASDAATMCWSDRRCFMTGSLRSGARDAIDSLRVPTQQYCVPRKHTFQLDELDRKLLDLLQNDAARPLYELGDLVGLSRQRRATPPVPLSIERGDRPPGRGAQSGRGARTVLACVLVTLERESKKLHSGFRARLLASARSAAVLRPGRRVGLPRHGRGGQHAALSHGHRRALPGCAEREALRDACSSSSRSSAA